MLLGFLTDIEGNMAYLERYVDISKVLRWGECEAGRRRLELIDPTRHYFVHGGDLFDKGPHDERLSALLVDLKRRHPDRVVLLMGNRDINKLRLAAELGPDDLARDVATLDAGLVPGVGGRTFAAYLREHGLEGDAHAAHDAATRLRWVYRDTLGCPGTFEFRRAELAALRGQLGAASPSAAVTDADVVASVRASLAPGGFVMGYLRAAQIGAVLGNSLFIHGGVPAAAVRFVPSLRVRYRHANDDPSAVPGARLPAATGDARAWVDALNRFAHDALDDFERRPQWDAERAARGGEALMAWQSRPASAGQTPVVASLLNRGAPTPVPDAVARFLAQRSGLRRVLCGHKPAGELPLPLRVASRRAGGGEARDAPPLLWVHADICYSDVGAPDKRGRAVTEVLVAGPTLARAGQTVVHGVLADGRAYRASLPDDPFVGKADADGFVVRARMVDGGDGGGGVYLLTRTRNRREERRFVARETLEEMAGAGRLKCF